jgi:hypothetical protein
MWEPPQILDDHVHPAPSELSAMPAADAKRSADLDEARVAVAERHEDIGRSAATGDVAMITHQVAAVARDRARPTARAIDAELEDLADQVAHAPILEHLFGLGYQ